MNDVRILEDGSRAVVVWNGGELLPPHQAQTIDPQIEKLYSTIFGFYDLDPIAEKPKQTARGRLAVEKRAAKIRSRQWWA